MPRIAHNPQEFTVCPKCNKKILGGPNSPRVIKHLGKDHKVCPLCGCVAIKLGTHIYHAHRKEWEEAFGEQLQLEVESIEKEDKALFETPLFGEGPSDAS